MKKKCFGITSGLNLKFCNRQVSGKYPYCQDHKYQPIYFVISILLAILIRLIVVNLTSEEATNQDSNELTDTEILEILQSYKFEDSLIFNILLLPLKPDEKCNQKETDFQTQLIERYERLKFENFGKIDFKYFPSWLCPITIQDALFYSDFMKADLVIWGSYEEECNEPDKVRIRYICTEDVVNKKHFEGDTDTQVIESLSQLRKGYLQKDIDYIIYSTLGIKSIGKSEYRKALEYFNKIKKINDCDNLNLFIAQAHFLLKEDKDAIKIYQKSMKCDSESLNVISNYNLGIIYSNQSKYSEAIKHFKKSAEINSEEYESFYQLCKSYAYSSKLDEGIKYFSDRIKENEEDADLLYYRGMLHLENGNSKYAFADFTYGIFVDPNHEKIKEMFRESAKK